MSTARQLVRWSIPGSLVLISAITTYATLRFVLGVTFPRALSPTNENVGALTGIALSIPAGFLCFQAYDWTYRPLRWFGFVSADRGGEVLSYLTRDQLRRIESAIPGHLLQEFHRVPDRDLEQIVAAGKVALLCDPFATPKTQDHPFRIARWTRWQVVAPVTPFARRDHRALRRAVRALYAVRWQTHRALNALLLDLSTMGADSQEVKAQWREEGDVYHSLGACRIAVGGGVALGTCADIAKLLSGRTPADVEPYHWKTIATFTALAAIAAFVMVVFGRIRATKFVSSSSRLGYGLRAVFASSPALLDGLQDSPAERARRREVTDSESRRAFLESIKRRIPPSSIWLRHALDRQLDPGLAPAGSMSLVDRSIDRLVLLSDADFSRALEASHIALPGKNR